MIRLEHPDGRYYEISYDPINLLFRELSGKKGIFGTEVHNRFMGSIMGIKTEIENSVNKKESEGFSVVEPYIKKYQGFEF